MFNGIQIQIDLVAIYAYDCYFNSIIRCGGFVFVSKKGVNAHVAVEASYNLCQLLITRILLCTYNMLSNVYHIHIFFAIVHLLPASHHVLDLCEYT